MVLRAYALTGSSHDIVYVLLIPRLIYRVQIVYVLRLPYIVKQREISGVAGEHPYVKIEQKTHLML